MQEKTVNLRGLITNKNELNYEGSLKDCENILIDKEGAVRSRRGLKQYTEDYTSKAKRLFFYKNKLYQVSLDKKLYNLDDKVLCNNTDIPNLKVDLNAKFYHIAGDSVYFITEDGLLNLYNNSLKVYGLGKALTPLIIQNPVFFIETTENIQSKIGVKVCYRYNDNNLKRLIRGEPSEPVWFYETQNNIDKATSILMLVPLPNNLPENTWLEVYLTRRAYIHLDETLSDIDEEYYLYDSILIPERNKRINSLAVGMIILYDYENDLKETLYTSPSQEGITGANILPYNASHIEDYKGYYFYAGGTHRESVSFKYNRAISSLYNRWSASNTGGELSVKTDDNNEYKIVFYPKNKFVLDGNISSSDVLYSQGTVNIYSNKKGFSIMPDQNGGAFIAYKRTPLDEQGKEIPQVFDTTNYFLKFDIAYEILNCYYNVLGNTGFTNKITVRGFYRLKNESSGYLTTTSRAYGEVVAANQNKDFSQAFVKATIYSPNPRFANQDYTQITTQKTITVGTSGSIITEPVYSATALLLPSDTFIVGATGLDIFLAKYEVISGSGISGLTNGNLYAVRYNAINNQRYFIFYANDLFLISDRGGGTLPPPADGSISIDNPSSTSQIRLTLYPAIDMNSSAITTHELIGFVVGIGASTSQRMYVNLPVVNIEFIPYYNYNTTSTAYSSYLYAYPFIYNQEDRIRYNYDALKEYNNKKYFNIRNVNLLSFMTRNKNHNRKLEIRLINDSSDLSCVYDNGITIKEKIEFGTNPPIEQEEKSAKMFSKNTIMYSKILQPEAVPIINYIPIGENEKPVLGLYSVDDYMIIFKEDGIYRLAGTNQDNFVVDKIDNTLKLESIYAVDSYVNTVFFLANNGINVIEGGNIINISVPILNLLKRILANNTSKNHFSLINPNDKLYYLFLEEKTNNGYASLCLTYNLETGEWTKQKFLIGENNLGVICGAIHPEQYKLFLEPYSNTGIYNYIYCERKEYPTSDLDGINNYLDEMYTYTVASINGNVITLNQTPTTDIIDGILTKNNTENYPYSYITDINKTLKTITIDKVRFTINTGDTIYCYKPIINKIELNYNNLGSHSAIKKLYEIVATFKRPEIYKMNATIMTDIIEQTYTIIDNNDIEWKNTKTNIEGYDFSSWFIKNKIFTIPKDTSICSYAKIAFLIKAPRAVWELLNINYLYDVIKARGMDRA